MRKAKSDYFLDLVSRSYTDPSKIWKTVSVKNKNNAASIPSSIKVDNCLVYNSDDICSVFNKHFSKACHIFDSIVVPHDDTY